ncbi:MAG: xanthine dehydrogenase molybdopterin binding subunit [Candidatus Obscuribacterales bacterium]|nr:xanthine dehydrogenase molybdopterin binding subunit [Candidatus Obscuribacterales bacterium]
MSIMGKDIPHDSAVGHVSGESIYIDDMPPLRNELFVDFVGSPYAHGKLISIDLSVAREIPGVVGLFTHKDLAHNRLGPIIQDEPLLVEDEAMFVGEPVVVVAAETKSALAKAKKAIKIEMEELTPTLTVNEARERQLFLDREYAVKCGDVEAAFKEAKHTIEGTLVVGGADHFYLESQACLAIPGENDQIVVHSSTQAPSEIQHTAAHILGLQQNQVVCVTKRMGGGFGGKESQATHPGVMAALVAHKTKRPARMIYIKDDDMRYTGKRHPFQNDYKVAFDDNGIITALQVHFFADGGAYNDLSIAVLGRAITHVDNAYFVANAELKGRICRTNLPPNTAFRGFGGPQGVITMECIQEEIAAYLGIPSLDVRRRNVYGIEERNTTPYGQIVRNNNLPKLFDQIMKTSQFRDRLSKVEEFNSGSETHLKGISITAIKFGISFTNTMLNQANALVNVYLDGTVQVSTGATEMGQGVNTNIKMLVADELGIDPGDVIVMATSTEKNNNTSATAASAATDLNGSAAVNACRKIKSNLREVAARHIASTTPGIGAYPDGIKFDNGIVYDERRPDAKMTFKELVGLAYRSRASLGERGFYATKGIEFDWLAGKGSPFLYFTMGCAVSEVTIDKLTGDMKVDRIDILMDVGKSINPGINRGQIVGAFIQGMGWLTNEELKYTDKGHLLNYSPTTYKIPNIQDVPDAFHVDVIDNYNTPNVRGTKAVGEPPLLLAISVWTAVKHALSFVAGDELPCLSAPATNEEILGRITFYDNQDLLSKDGRGATSWRGEGANGAHYRSIGGLDIPTIKHGSLRPISESVAVGYDGASGNVNALGSRNGKKQRSSERPRQPAQ